MPRDDVAGDRREALLRARDGLLRELAGIATVAAERARSRCPYRDRHDRCTFGGGCRNQRRDAEPGFGCSGDPLDPRPAHPWPGGAGQAARTGSPVRSGAPPGA
jgi:ribosome modulation factor